jgi:hypothetical protein
MNQSINRSAKVNIVDRPTRTQQPPAICVVSVNFALPQCMMRKVTHPARFVLEWMVTKSFAAAAAKRCGKIISLHHFI